MSALIEELKSSLRSGGSGAGADSVIKNRRFVEIYDNEILLKNEKTQEVISM